MMSNLFKIRSVAQLVEHRSPKPGVVGSSPPTPARFSAHNQRDGISARRDCKNRFSAGFVVSANA